jgi:HSP20 family molecular chaperone IbpA
LSDHDDFDEVFRDFHRFVGPVSGSGVIDESAMADLPQLDDESVEVEDELILGSENVTYLLYAAGRELEDFSISAGEEELEVRTREFTVRKALGARVDPTGARASYRNGVLSVKMKRKGM